MKSENSYECDFAAEEWDIVGPSIPIRSIINEKTMAMNYLKVSALIPTYKNNFKNFSFY